MNPEALKKLWPLVMIRAQMTRAFRWMLRMGFGEVHGLPEDIVLVLTVLDVALFSYVTAQMARNDLTCFGSCPRRAPRPRNILALMVIDLLIPVFEKATELM